jgi:hypothetical protein
VWLGVSVPTPSIPPTCVSTVLGCSVVLGLDNTPCNLSDWITGTTLLNTRRFTLKLVVLTPADLIRLKDDEFFKLDCPKMTSSDVSGPLDEIGKHTVSCIVAE